MQNVLHSNLALASNRKSSFLIIVCILLFLILQSHQLTLQKRKGRDYRHVVHLDSVIESEEEPEEHHHRFEQFVPKHEAVFGMMGNKKTAAADALDSLGDVSSDYLGDDLAETKLADDLLADYKPSSVGRPHGGDDDEDNSFYDMVLNILGTFHSAAESNVRQAHKRAFL